MSLSTTKLSVPIPLSSHPTRSSIMNTKFLTASVAAGVTLFILGWVLYGALLMDFFSANTMSADLWKERPDFLFLVLGELVTGAALVFVVSTLGGATDFMGGMKTGAMFGLLFGLGLALTFYATSNMMSLAAWLGDTVVTIIRFGIAAGVGALVIGKMGGTADEGATSAERAASEPAATESPGFGG